MTKAEKIYVSAMKRPGRYEPLVWAINEAFEVAAQHCDAVASGSKDGGCDQLCEDTADILAKRIRAEKSQS